MAFLMVITMLLTWLLQVVHWKVSVSDGRIQTLCTFWYCALFGQQATEFPVWQFK